MTEKKGASHPPAKTAKPPIKRPAEFQPGSHVERQRDRAWTERDNPNLAERKTHGVANPVFKKP